MTFLSRILARLGRSRIETEERSRHSNLSEPGHAEGSGAAPGPDRESTTGTGRSGHFVGRVEGEDAGSLSSGAERRQPSDDRSEQDEDR